MANLLFSPVGVILNGYPAPLPNRTLFSQWNLFRNIPLEPFLNTLYIFPIHIFNKTHFVPNIFRLAHRYCVYNAHTAPLTAKYNIILYIICDGKMRVIRNIPTVHYTRTITIIIIIILFLGRYCMFMNRLFDRCD